MYFSQMYFSHQIHFLFLFLFSTTKSLTPKTKKKTKNLKKRKSNLITFEIQEFVFFFPISSPPPTFFLVPYSQI